jgi:hypothetical protein
MNFAENFKTKEYQDKILHYLSLKLKIFPVFERILNNKVEMKIIIKFTENHMRIKVVLQKFTSRTLRL